MSRGEEWYYEEDDNLEEDINIEPFLRYGQAETRRTWVSDEILPL